MSVGVQIGVDIGGTFTDVVCRLGDGTLQFVKLPTTRRDESQGVLQSIALMQREWKVDQVWLLPPSVQERFHSPGDEGSDPSSPAPKSLHVRNLLF